jgi:hypothetical protein
MSGRFSHPGNAISQNGLGRRFGCEMDEHCHNSAPRPSASHGSPV